VPIVSKITYAYCALCVEICTSHSTLTSIQGFR